MDEQPDYSYVLNLISKCDDVSKLTTFINNAQRKQVDVVREAAYQRLKSFIPKSNIKGFEADFWTMFSAYEDVLIAHAKPTVKLNTARERALTEGPKAALEYWILYGHQAWAFEHFMTHGQADLTAQSLVLKYKDMFEPKTCKIARNRLLLFKNTKSIAA